MKGLETAACDSALQRVCGATPCCRKRLSVSLTHTSLISVRFVVLFIPGGVEKMCRCGGEGDCLAVDWAALG